MPAPAAPALSGDGPVAERRPGAVGPGRLPHLSRAALAAILVAAVLGGIFGAAIVLDQPPVHRSSTVVEIRRPDVFLDVNPGTISVLNALRSKYAALIGTEPVVAPAAAALGVEADRIRGSVGAAITSDSLLFYPFATAATPERAVAIAQATTEALVDYAADEQASANVPGEEQIELRIVQGASRTVELGPDSRRAMLVALVFAAVAAAVAYGGTVAAQALRTARRSPG